MTPEELLEQMGPHVEVVLQQCKEWMGDTLSDAPSQGFRAGQAVEQLTRMIEAHRALCGPDFDRERFKFIRCLTILNEFLSVHHTIDMIRRNEDDSYLEGLKQRVRWLQTGNDPAANSLEYHEMLMNRQVS